MVSNTILMQEFFVYLQLGIDHILDPAGLDHTLFIITLCAVYQPRNWRQILVLVTAFTIGHSLTLVLSSLQLLKVDAKFVETLIPITIILTALYNVLTPNEIHTGKQKVHWNYLLALSFGLIHGLGFANFFKAMLIGSESIIFPLFAFNIGIEVAQLIIVSLFMAMVYLLVTKIKIPHFKWNLFVSGVGFGMALALLLN